MLSFFKQPFPVSELNLSKTLGLSLLFGAMIAFCLVVFQPFGSYNWHSPTKNLVLSGYGLVAAFSVFLNFYGFRRMAPAFFHESRWNVGKEILWNLVHFVTGGFLSTVYGAAMGIMPFSLPQISYMILVAFMMGLVPAILIVLIMYLYLLQKYRPISLVRKEEPVVAPLAVESPVQNISTPTEQEPTNTHITLIAENGKDTLTLEAAHLLYIEASDNYCTVFYLQNNALQKHLLRSSLSRLENQITQLEVVRCHRSYLVNLDRVQNVSGNAQGYKLHFAQTGQTVPVARASSSVVKSFFVAS
ncbi:LytTR family transcriptional regulator [Nibribacter ruber]|uniref:LytTR family transcriptional regulator n=1 Tax=Nibribacter ruber TaxID=2698458 RepID=A0A6P1P0R5_9BACT|nr:LytTR family DNA-binding domain-containing protein [Nibribacter ruber]QHL87998.1 LytTR family transcriptional regulator [Nibribacter ruber]